MKLTCREVTLFAITMIGFCEVAGAQSSKSRNAPTWWDKFQYLSKNGSDPAAGATTSTSVSGNVDVSNECGPQSETYITLDPVRPSVLAAGSNEIFRDPMRGYFSTDDGATWGGVDLPLPPPLPGTNDRRFGSDPSLAFDTRGNAFYGYIVVFFGGGSGVNGTEMAVARSSNGGRTYPQVTFFSFESGGNHFNDKPIITADTNPRSRFRDNVYITWDAATGGSTSGGIRVARSSDHGASFSINRADDPGGPGKSIGAVPFVGPDGEVYVAWNDYKANVIAFNRSLDGGATWGRQATVAGKAIPFALGIPAESFRGALVYPACDTDRSTGPRRGRLYCSWMDLTADGVTTTIVLSYSNDRGASWTRPAPVGDVVPGTDRFNHWLSVDPVTGAVNVAFYDTRNDTTGQRFITDNYLAQSTDGVSWLPDRRVSTVSSNEHDCDGVFPCVGINYGNQQGDYEGLVSFGGASHPIWTDSRRQLDPIPGCPRGLAMEEVFTATVR